MTTRSLLKLLSPVDVVSIGFLFFITTLNVIFHTRVEHWFLLVLVNIAATALIVTLAWLAETRKTKLLIGLHRWYCYPFVILVFKEIYLMVRPIHPIDYDQLFISIDYAIFGVHPTQWFAQFAHPVLTEFLSLAYFSYYLTFIIVGVELYRRFPIREFDTGAFLLVYGFYLSYLGYFLLPAVGPRFTLHDFYAINQELPGFVITPFVRDFVNAGESVSFAMADAYQRVQRDVFPSGHSQMTLVCVYLAFRYRLPLRFVVAVLATFLIVSTVYLRYHYVVDLVGGALFFVFTIWSGKKIQAGWERWKTEGE
jgi:membrane-associated phospholipid phosphatase